MPVRTLIPSDPRFGAQWHLKNNGGFGKTADIDINIVDVWDDYTGEGVIVGVVDDGVEYTHPDLAGNYDTSLDRDAVENDNNAAPSSADDNHGTAVAGVIGAVSDDYNVVGVAYDSTIVGLRIGFTDTDGPDQPASHFNYAVTAGIDILNNSWGYGGYFNGSDDFSEPFFSSLESSIENAVENGRDGLGTIIFFSSGNSGDQGQDANYHNVLNSRHTITVGAINGSGNIAYFSTPGAPVFVSLPGQSVQTTDRVGADGYSSQDYVSVSGTSFSSPIGAGIAALLLEANPDLGWRDVQEIFALSAIQIDPSDTSWILNGATNWNGGGMHTSRWYGFGLTDTLAAVRLAETWTMQHTSANETSVSGSSSPNSAINDLGTVTDQINIASGVEIDHVLINLEITHTAPVDLVVTLISPDGTESQLIVQPGLVPGSDTTPQDGEAGEDGVPADNISFTLSSTEFWGETGEGTWTIRVEDTLSGDSGTFNSWSIELWGDPLTDDTTYYFTDEYATFAGADVARQILDDADGTNTINAAAVTSNLVIDLTGTSPSTIALTPLTFAAGTIMHNAYAGDGNDTLIGNAFDNTLFGGRGDDTLTGAEGTDTVVYLSNSTEFTFTLISPTEIQVSYTGTNGIDEGTDIVTGVEFFEFGETTLTKNEVIVLAGGSVGPEFTSGPTADFAEEGAGTAYDADATVESGPAATYAISGGADAALFNIDSVTGEVTFKTAPDFETPGDNGGNNTYDIEITASSDSGDTAQSVAITVTNINDNAPVFSSGLTADFEETGSGTAYTAQATDVDGETPTYSITGGADASLFNINTATGEVTFVTPPDYEAPTDAGEDNDYEIEITASDGLNETPQNVTISVTDLSGPPTFTSGTTATFTENAAGTAYDANATSPDGPSPTFAITGGADAAQFDINSNTGEVTFKAAPDYEAPSDVGGDNTYDIEITADSSGLVSTQTVAITVANANDIAPIFTSGTTADFAENGFGIAYDADATDADGETPTYAITGGADAAFFNINSTTGEVTFKVSPDYETPADNGGDNTYDIEITADDGVNQTAQSVAITVTDIVNEFNIINGTPLEDELTGTNAADQINGLDGNDFITGGAGIDQLNGGDGDDVFLVGISDTPDVFNGGTGTDTIAAVESGVEIVFAGGIFGPSNSIEVITNNAPNPAGDFTVLTGTSANDILDVSTETVPYYIDGLEGRDTILGGSADDVLIGGTDRNRLTGNAGADTFVVTDLTTRDSILDFDTASGDVINMSGVTGFSSFADVQLNMVSTFGGGTLINLPNGGWVIVTNVDPADFSADDFEFSPAPSPSALVASTAAVVANTTIGGTAGADNYDFSATLLDGIDAINMGDGNDTVVGSVDADVINGEGDNDTLTGAAGNDTIDGGGGTDTAIFSGNRGAYTATQIDSDSVTLVGPDGTDAIHNVELFEFDDGTFTFADLLGIVHVPTFSSGDSSDFAENATGTAYDADATDLDSAAPTYAITGGADAAHFDIDVTTGEVTFLSVPDYEAPADFDGNNTYEIEITASSNGDDTPKTVTINVTNENDNSPIITSGVSADFVENGVGTAYDANATDDDGNVLTYSISGGADAALFTINTATGEVTFVSAPDYETPLDVGFDNDYEIEVTASDGVTSDMLAVSISVTDFDENAPAYTVLTGTTANDILDVSAETVPYYIDGLEGRDTILGGSADDVLIGGTDRNKLTGNAGADIFVITDLTTRDSILDFDTTSGDVINMSGVTGFNNFADVQANMVSTFGGGTLINLPNGGWVIVTTVDPSSFSADDFVFDPAPSPATVVPNAEPAVIETFAFGQSGDDFIWSGVQSTDLLSNLNDPDTSLAAQSLDAGAPDAFIWDGDVGSPKSWLAPDPDDTQPLIEHHFMGESSVTAAGTPQLIKPVEGQDMPLTDFDWDHGQIDFFAELQPAHLDHFIL